MFQVAHSADHCNVFFITGAGASVICAQCILSCPDQHEDDNENSLEPVRKGWIHLGVFAL